MKNTTITIIVIGIAVLITVCACNNSNKKPQKQKIPNVVKIKNVDHQNVTIRSFPGDVYMFSADTSQGTYPEKDVMAAFANFRNAHPELELQFFEIQPPAYYHNIVCIYTIFKERE